MPAIIVLIAALISVWQWQQEKIGSESDENTGIATKETIPPDGIAAHESTPERLRAVVKKLSSEIGARNLQHYSALNATADYIESELQHAGYSPQRQTFEVAGFACHNLIAELPGKVQPEKILIVGAHYDSCLTTPGANDNATGVAGLLEVANQLVNTEPDCTIRFVAWTNEEPPYFQREQQMGSLVHARRCHQENEDIIGVIALETMGYFNDEPGSQHYPPLLAPLYPDTGNFIGFVSNLQSAAFLRKAVASFKRHTEFPCEQASLPDLIQGVGWSDHWSYWQVGYPGLMVTDTAPFRYPHYHKETDTMEKVSYKRLAEVVDAMAKVIQDLSKSEKSHE